MYLYIQIVYNITYPYVTTNVYIYIIVIQISVFFRCSLEFARFGELGGNVT